MEEKKRNGKGNRKESKEEAEEKPKKGKGNASPQQLGEAKATVKQIKKTSLRNRSEVWIQEDISYEAFANKKFLRAHSKTTDFLSQRRAVIGANPLRPTLQGYSSSRHPRTKVQ